MQRRRIVVGVALIALGVYLLLAPIVPGPETTTSLKPGDSVDLFVWSTASVSGSEVAIRISWDSPICPTPGLSCDVQIFPPYIDVFDCGTLACQANHTLVPIGTTQGAAGSAVDVSARPGHHYELLVQSQSTNPQQSAPLTIHYSVHTPALSGLVGVALLGGGSVVLGLAVRPLRDQPQRPT